MWVSAVMLMAVAGCGSAEDGASGASSSGGDAPTGSAAPRDASVEDFCATFEATSGFISGEDAAVELARTGTVPEISDDARRGFEYLIDHPEGGEHVISNPDVGTYVTYGSTTCADLVDQ